MRVVCANILYFLDALRTSGCIRVLILACWHVPRNILNNTERVFFITTLLAIEQITPILPTEHWCCLLSGIKYSSSSQSGFSGSSLECEVFRKKLWNRYSMTTLTKVTFIFHRDLQCESPKLNCHCTLVTHPPFWDFMACFRVSCTFTFYTTLQNRYTYKSKTYITWTYIDSIIGQGLQ